VEESPSLIGIDHGFSFPMAYFRKHKLHLSWSAFLDDFQAHWPSDQDNIYVQFVRDGICGAAHARSGDPRWRRVAEVRAGAKSVFHFDVQGSVAKSTHAGLPWLWYSGRVPAADFISGRSTAGCSHQAKRWWRKSIPLSGAASFHARIATVTNTMLTQLPHGCVELMGTALYSPLLSFTWGGMSDK
jgi:hypothetical protein